MSKQAKPPQIGKSAFVVIDTDGRVVWSFCHEDRQLVSEWGAHPGRKVARVEVVEIVRKARKPKESKR